MQPIILAGGSGTRFWPVSRRHRPKQLLQLLGKKTMIRETIERISSREPWIVCGEHLLEHMREEVVLPDRCWLVEPVARNTAPAIAIAAKKAFDDCNDEVVAILPSDHAVQQAEAFRQVLSFAEEVAENGYIVTIGINPSRPETGFGYILYDSVSSPIAHTSAFALTAFRVNSFVEKPDLETAQRYYADKNTAWNAGMFVFKPSVVLKAFEEHQPEIFGLLNDYKDLSDPAFADAFEAMPSISFDFAVMEHAKNIAVIPAGFGWSDVGHWAALDELRQADGSGNVIHGDAILIDSRNTTVWTETDRVVACLGLDNIVVVETEDAVLVLPKERSQDVKSVVAEIANLSLDELL